MLDALIFIKNNQDLLSLLRNSPSFHGAEILHLIFRHDTIGRICLEAKIRFELSPERNGNPGEVERKSVIVTLNFVSADVHFLTHYHKTLSDISITRVETDQNQQEKFLVEIHTIEGGREVAFYCSEIAVVKMEYPT